MNRTSSRMLGLIVALAAAGCGNQIDAAKAETSMRDGLAAKGVTAKITCPSGIAAKAGKTFQCDAVDEAGAHHAIEVTQRDDKGTIAWKLDGLIVDTAVVIADAKAKLPGTEITCPHKGVIVKGNSSFECAAREGDKARTLVVKVEGENVGWELSP